MKKVQPILLLFIVSLVLLSSCTVESVAPDDSWESVFLQFWNAMNMEYAHFDIESNLDWDDVYDKYLPLFRELDYANEKDTVKAFTYFKEITIDISDCHFRLIVRDNFNNFLQMIPADERKWMSADQNHDHTHFPDMSYGGSMISADGQVTISDDEATGDAQIAEFYGGIEGYYEVNKLTANGTFHNTGTTFKASQGYSFKTYKKDEAKDDKVKEAWNNVVNTFDLDGISYYYGVTDDDVFYFYFSYFFSYDGTPLSEELIYKETLTEEEKAKLKEKKLEGSDKDYLAFHDYIWGEINKGHSDKSQYFKGIYEMFEILKSIGQTGKCKMKNSSGVEEEYKIKGVVMDVRGNQGGDNTTLETIFGAFFKNETKFAETRYKEGYNRYEYSPWMDLTIEKKYCTAEKDYENPFVIITNGYSVSCSELSASIVKNLMKNGIVVGNTTYGATCTKVKRSLYHSGTFSSKNLEIVMASLETRLKTRDGSYESFENKGIEPTEGQKVDVDATYATDARFEAAVRAAKGESSST